MDGDRRDQMRVASSMGDAAGDWEKIMFDKSSEISGRIPPVVKNLILRCATEECSIVRRKAYSSVWLLGVRLR